MFRKHYQYESSVSEDLFSNIKCFLECNVSLYLSYVLLHVEIFTYFTELIKLRGNYFDY